MRRCRREIPSSLSSTLEMIPISYRSLRRSIAAFASRKGGHDATLSGRNWAREGSIVQPISSGGLHRGPAQDLGVELVGTGHDLGLDLEEALQEGALVDREAIAIGLPLEGVADALLPVDQGAVAIRGHPLDVFELRKGHESRGIMAICILRPLLTASAGRIERSYNLSRPWISSSIRESSSSPATAFPCPRPGRRHRRGRRRGGRGDRLSVRDQGPGADRRPRQGRRNQGRAEQGRGRGARGRRSSAWTSAARGARARSPSTRSGSRAPRRSRPSTTPRSSSTAPPRSCWRCSRRWAA